ncbi:MAG TPA: hypothetical protein VGO62_15430 [Myxococcota bacterium]
MTAPTHPSDRNNDTLPGAPALLPRLDDDERFRALAHQCADARAFLADRAWDNLAHIQRFASACVSARPLLAEYAAPSSRRRIAHLVHALLPAPARSIPFLPLADEVEARAPDFRIFPGDVPRIAPIYSAFLARPDLLERVLVPGAIVLAPKHILRIESVDAAAVRGTLAVDDGRAVSAPLDVVTAWLFSAGPDARGLDLRSDDDRALLLMFASALRKSDVRGRSAFAWLEDGGAPVDVRVDVVSACVRAAVDVVARHTIDPLAARIVLHSDGGDGSWQRLAAAALDEVGLFHDVVARGPSRRTQPPALISVVPTSTPSAPPSSSDGKRDVLWADALLPPGYAAGRASAVAAGRAFARLATSLLAPLGVLPSSGHKDGSGAVILQRLAPTVADDGVAGVALLPPRVVTFDLDGGDREGDAPWSRARDRALVDAWGQGDARAIAEPRGSPHHDVAAMPAWLAFFLEGL